MEPGSPAPLSFVVLIVVGWLVVFPLMWLGISGLLSVVGGWRELAGSYVADPAVWKGTPAQTTSGALQRWFLPVNYSHTLRVHVWSDGFGLATPRVFRFMHPPLFIPWSAVRECQQRSLLFWDYVQISLHNSSVSIMVGGRPGREIQEQWRMTRATPGGAPAVAHVPGR